MPTLARNRNTQQPSIPYGKTQDQIIKLIPAPRVYIKSADSRTSTPVQAYNTKSNGSTPNGWTDLGHVLGNATITYEKEIRDIETGIDQILRQSYIQRKTATMEFTLANLDDVVMEQLMAVTASQFVSGSAYNFQIGSEDIIERAIMAVVQNKLDSKEWQFYNPAAQVSFAFVEEDDAFAVRVTAKLIAFKAQGLSASDPEALLSSTIFA